MSADCSFSSVLEASQQSWTASGGEDTLLSLTLPLDGIDPLQALPVLADQAAFQMLMDGAPGLCLAAAGSCQQLELAGARRFELAQRFADLSLSRLVDTRADSPAQARPRVLLRFRFFEQVGEHHHGAMHPPAVEAVLPRWQLTSQGRRGWLRLNGVVNSAAEARELAEQLWLKCEQLQADLPSITDAAGQRQPGSVETALQPGC